MSGWGWRPWLLVAVLASTLWVIVDVAQENELGPDKQEREEAPNQKRSGATEEGSLNGSAGSVESLRLDFLVREKTEMETTNPFSPSTWYRPPPRPRMPPPLPPPLPPEPTAPPLPFKYFGSYEEGQQRIVLLLKGEQMYTLAEGDYIDNT